MYLDTLLWPENPLWYRRNYESRQLMSQILIINPFLRLLRNVHGPASSSVPESHGGPRCLGVMTDVCGRAGETTIEQSPEYNIGKNPVITYRVLPGGLAGVGDERAHRTADSGGQDLRPLPHRLP